MSKRYEIEMPDDWTYEWCEDGACNKCYEINNRRCPLAKAKLEAKEKPTAPASLHKEITDYLDDRDLCRSVDEGIRDILSRYRPSTQADIVGELKEVIIPESRYGVTDIVEMAQITGRNSIRKSVEEIIRKHGGTK